MIDRILRPLPDSMYQADQCSCDTTKFLSRSVRRERERELDTRTKMGKLTSVRSNYSLLRDRSSRPFNPIGFLLDEDGTTESEAVKSYVGDFFRYSEATGRTNSVIKELGEGSFIFDAFLFGGITGKKKKK